MLPIARALPGAVLVTMSLIWGCGGDVVYLECPLGTRPEGSRCVPLASPDTAGPGPDVAAPTEGDTGATAPDAAPDVLAPGPETAGGVDAASGGLPAGSPCALNAVCAGGTCLDWPTGYCARIDCATRWCEAAELCVDLAAGNSACLARCDGDADCRTPHQACKKLLQDDGTLAGVCVGIQPDAVGPGAACADPARCLGQATCLAAFPGGYCAELGCTAGSCEDGTDCVFVNGTPACLRFCARDRDCGSVPGAERACGVLTGVGGGPSQVCISGISGRALGARCLSDFECTSGVCQILGEGRCNGSQVPCSPANEAEACGVGDYCRVTSDSRVGLCSRPCSAGVPCLGASFCVAEGARPRDTWCRPACGDGVAVCAADSGLACHLGLPLGDGGQGRYACSASVLGGPFVSCVGDATCGGGRCVKPASGAGYCAGPCGDDDHCGFGGACVRVSGDARCWRMCQSDSECPSGFRCDVHGDGARTVCVPR